MAVTINGSAPSTFSHELSFPNVGRRNLIINGGFDVRQRGDSFNRSNDVGPYYTYDRWFGSQTGDGVTDESWSLPADTISDGSYQSVLEVKQATSVGISRVCQIIEASSTAGLKNSVATLSFDIKGVGTTTDTYSVYIIYDTDASMTSSIASTTTFEFSDTSVLAYTGVIPNTWTRVNFTTSQFPAQVGAVGVVIMLNSGGSAGRAMRLRGVQLELGSVATPFEHRSYGEELALCQRYYQILSVGYYHGGSSDKYLTGTLGTPMRTSPSATRVGNVVSGFDAGTTITFNSPSWYYIHNNSTSVGGIFNLDAEL